MKKSITLFFAICGMFFCSGVWAQSNIINTIAGNGTSGFSGDGGTATSAELFFPYGICVDKSGNVYIAEWGNHRIREVSASTGNITTIAGTGNAGYSGDGGLATNAELWGPYDLKVDVSGNIFYADANEARIRRIDNATGNITTIAGNGTSGFAGDGAAATSAEINYPTGLVLDALGNIYIADQNNNRIRKITISSGIITTIAGTGIAGFSGDGAAATSAELSAPQRLALDNLGNIYIVDNGNSRVRKITISTGIITTIAGTGTVGYTGDGGLATSATFNDICGVVLDNSGNVYIADANNNVIREIDHSTGIINPLAGNGVQGYSGNGGAATLAELYHPCDMAIDVSGNMYFDDDLNYVVRKIGAPLAINEVNSSFADLILYPNPTNGMLYLSMGKNINKGTTIIIYNLLGQEVTKQTIEMATSNINLNISGLNSGTYLLKIVSVDGSMAVRRFEVTR
jgi:hypothetical protein